MADATSKPELLSTILSACHTKIFLPDDEALTPAMTQAYQAVGLTTAEIQILAKAQKKRDYYYRSVKGRRLFELGLGPAALALVGASSEQDQLFLDELVATREPSEYARAMLERRGAVWAASEPAPPRAAAADIEGDADGPDDGRSLCGAHRLRRADSDDVTTVPCPPPPRPPRPFDGAREPHERAHPATDPLRRARVRGSSPSSRRAPRPRRPTSSAATWPC